MFFLNHYQSKTEIEKNKAKKQKYADLLSQKCKFMTIDYHKKSMLNQDHVLKLINFDEK